MNKPVLIILCCCFSMLLYSQDVHFPDTIHVFDEVNVFAKKNNENTGVKILKIDSIIIEKNINKNLSELLSENSTVFVKVQGRGALSTASFRGTNASHTKITWNNILLNSPQMGMVDLSQIPLFITENIEIFHGPASILRNKNALGGLIELNTKCDWNKGIRLKTVNSLGSFSTIENSVALKIGNETFQSVTKIYRNSSKNDYPFKNNDIYNGSIERRKNADYTYKGVLQEFYYKSNKNYIASTKLWYQNSDRGIPGLSTNQAAINSNINRQKGDLLTYSTEFSKYSDKIKFEFYHGGSYQNYIYTSTNFISGVGYIKVLDSNLESFSLFNHSILKHKISSKFEYSIKLNINKYIVISHERIRNLGYDKSRNEAGIIFSAFLNLSEKFKLSTTYRQELYDKKLSAPIPLLAGEYFISKKSSIKIAVYQNYNIPGLNDLYFIPGGNPELKPEISQGFDIGLNKVIVAQKKLYINSEINTNYNKIKNWIMWRPSAMGYWVASNIQQVTSYGVDFNNKFTYESKYLKFYSLINYAFTRSFNSSEPSNENDNSTGKQIAYIPKHSANIYSNLNYKNFYFSYQWTFYSKRYTSSAEEPGILVSIYPYFMNDIFIGKKIYFKKYYFDLNFRIYNLFNESYRSVLWQPMPGRNYSITITINFR